MYALAPAFACAVSGISGSESDSEEEILDITTPEVLAKYRLSAEIANRTLQKVIGACKPGTRLLDLCELGDNSINEECGKVHNKGKAKVETKDKGVAFPTCISVNHVAGHYSCTVDDEAVLAAGDLAKIDMAVHIDGWVAAVAHTVLVSEEPEVAFEGPQANLMMACAVASEGALAAIKPGVKNTDVTEIFSKAAAAFGVNVVEGVLSHQTKRFVIDGNKAIISKVVPGEQAVDEEEFEVNDVYILDVIMSTGEGKPTERDEKKQMIFKRAVDQTYNLKMKVSREIFSKITTDHPTLPFTLRQYEDSRARLGMKECMEHDLFHTYPVLEEKDGDLVAQMKFTLMITEEGTQRITGGFLPNCPELKCEDEDLGPIYQAALDKAAKKKAKKNKKK